MLTLAIDTAADPSAASDHESVGDRVLGAVSEEIGRGHAERLMAVIDACLAEASVEIGAIGRIGVTIGPGSFTGIRVGVSAARGLALALGCPAVGISTLEAIGAAGALSGKSPVLAVIDAKRGEIYAQLFRPDGAAAGPAGAVSPEAAADVAHDADASLAGSGAGIVAAASGAHALHVLPGATSVDITRVARLASARPGPFESPKPLYLRGADAKPQEGFALARKPVAAR
jgi:tRNA threonylcarbamoyl adenosine modification protein YeaZ